MAAVRASPTGESAGAKMDITRPAEERQASVPPCRARLSDDVDRI
jgi:hypothetical protein